MNEDPIFDSSITKSTLGKVKQKTGVYIPFEGEQELEIMKAYEGYTWMDEYKDLVRETLALGGL